MRVTEKGKSFVDQYPSALTLNSSGLQFAQNSAAMVGYAAGQIAN